MVESVVLSVVLQKLADPLIQEALFLYGVRDKVEWLQDELEWMHKFQIDAAANGRGGSEVIKHWVKKMMEVAVQAEVIIDNFTHKIESKEKKRGLLRRIKSCAAFPCNLISHHNIGTEIEGLRSRIDHIKRAKDEYKLVETTPAPAPKSSCKEVSFTVGPWGGTGGSVWHTDSSACLRKMKIRHGLAIDSIVFQYEDRTGATHWSPVRGGDGGDLTEINLEEGEYLKSISGYYGQCRGSTVVRSLTFISNIRTFGPYGRERETPFSLPTVDGRIIGFHGRSSALLDAFGVYVKPIQRNNEGTVMVGPWGGNGGFLWCMSNGASRLLKLKIRHGLVIDSIVVQYETNGISLWSTVAGGQGGSLSEINLEEGEYLNSIRGYYGQFSGCTVVRSLTFISNIRTFGPYGRELGTPFSLPTAVGGRIMGFHGRSSALPDAFGVYVKPIQRNIEGTVMVGPWGGNGGSLWCMSNGASRLLKLKIRHGHLIHSIVVQYETNGIAQWSTVAGGEGGSLSEINLEDEEIITSIAGHHGNFNGYFVVLSLTISTNIRKHGPYGKEEGTAFSLPISGSMIIGFHGRSGIYLDAIGVYLKNIN